ncbi:MAG: hypothetical protein BroJett040_13930 [Oligoflexia bacterium]|nr:MAG: hypothetical protein BroJett040_13930 [Oligoflexia bacterium]
MDLLADHYDVNKVFKLISDYFLLRDRKDRDVESLMALRVFQIIIGSTLCFFCAIAIHYALHSMYSAALVHISVVLISCFAWLAFKKTNSTVIAGSIVLAAGYPLFIYRGYVMGGITSPGFIIIQIIPICTMALMPLRAAALWSLAYALIPFGFYYANDLGIYIPEPTSDAIVPSTRLVLLNLIQVISFLTVYYVKKLNQSYAALIKERSEENANLVRIITHDIATPLAVLQLGLEIIKEKTGDSPEMERIEKAFTAINGITAKVRELEAIQTGKKEFKLESVCFLRAFDEISSIFTDSLERKNIQFGLHYEGPSESYRVKSDEKGLTLLILSNLMSNAIKFTEPGGRIDVYLERKGPKVICRFVDSGIGIPEKILNQLFDPTKHTNRRGTDGEKGTGFGMPIVKSLTEKFGGTIQVESKTKGQHQTYHGTIFTLTFPAYCSIESSISKAA